MAVADAASLRTIAVQLRSLSADRDNQPIIAREEGCMNALMSFLTPTDPQVTTIAVAALSNLASHPDNFDLFRSEQPLLNALKALLLSEHSSTDLRQDVFDVLEELTNEDDDDEMDELDLLETSAGLVEKPNTFDDEPGLLKDPVTARLHVPGLSDEVFCVRIEQLLVRKQGVISVVFEIGAEVAVVFTRLPPEALSSFVSTMTGTSVQILPSEADSESEEEADSEGEEAHGVLGKENGGGQPRYLDETGQTLRDVARKNARKKHTITQGASSLHERLKAQREEESRKKARANRLVNSIGRGMNSGWGLW